MKPQAFPRKKISLSVQAALIVMLAATSPIALGETTYTTSLPTPHPRNSARDMGGHNIFFDSYFDLSSGGSVTIGGINGSDNTVTLSSGTGQHVIGELRDEQNNPANEWAEGNTVNLSSGIYGDVAGGLGTGKAGAGRHETGGTNGGGNVVNISGTAEITLGVFGGFAAGNGGGDAVNNKVNITGGTFTHTDEIYGGYSTGGGANDNEVLINVSATGFPSIEAIIGGYAKTGANNNRVKIQNGFFTNRSEFLIGGGYAMNNGALGNVLTITGGTFIDSNAGDSNSLDFIGGVAYSGEVSSNKVEISDSASFADARIQGGSARGATGQASNNEVNISGATFTVSAGNRDIIGGYSAYDRAQHNKVRITGGTFTNTSSDSSLGIWGGQGANADNNEIHVEGGTFTSDGSNGLDFYGGESRGSGISSNNKVLLSGGDFTNITDNFNVLGGTADSGNATNNSVSVSANTANKAEVVGGFTQTGTASLNSVSLSGSATTTNNIWGGYAENGTTDGNVVNASDSAQIHGNIIGGEVENGSGTSSNNKVRLSGNVAANDEVIGGRAVGNATGNEVFLSDNARANDDVIGGESTGGNATGNTVSLNDSSTIVASSGKVVIGGLVGATGNATGNTVNIDTSASLSTIGLYGGKYESSGSGDLFTDNTLNFAAGWSGAVASVVLHSVWSLICGWHE